MNTLNRINIIIYTMIFALSLVFCGCADKDWQGVLKERISLLGHRNWIIIADFAYPIQTIYTGDGHLEVLQTVLQEIDKAPHIKANILLDAELDIISSEAAPGIDQYRRDLKRLLKGKQANALPHEEIISKLDRTSQLFTVLILKTNMVLPYTSVFLELDCGYWNAEKEEKMRELIDGN